MDELERDADEHQAPEKQHQKSSPRKRSPYWLFWLFVAVLSIFTTAMGQAPSLVGAIGAIAAIGAYTYYLYQGGSFVLKPKWWLVLIILALPVFMLFGPDDSKTPNTLSTNTSSASELSVPAPRTETKADTNLQKKYPIVAKLPYNTTEYKITYATGRNATAVFTVDLTPPNAVGQPGDDAFKQWINQYKKEAVDFLEDNDVDPSKDTVIFTVWGAQD